MTNVCPSVLLIQSRQAGIYKIHISWPHIPIFPTIQAILGSIVYTQTLYALQMFIRLSKTVEQGFNNVTLLKSSNWDIFNLLSVKRVEKNRIKRNIHVHRCKVI